MKYIVTLAYDQIPEYNKLRKIFQDGLRKRKFTDDGLTVKFTNSDVASSSDEAFHDVHVDNVSTRRKEHTITSNNDVLLFKIAGRISRQMFSWETF